MIFFPTTSFFEDVDVDDEDAAAKKVLFGLERAAARRQRLLEREVEEIFRDEAVDGCRAANNIFFFFFLNKYIRA